MRGTDLEQLRFDLLMGNHQCAMVQLLVPLISKVEHDYTYSCRDQLPGSHKLEANFGHKTITELTFTNIKCQDIEKKTRQQSNSILWHQVRGKRITGSQCGRILCMKKYAQNLSVVSKANALSSQTH